MKMELVLLALFILHTSSGAEWSYSGEHGPDHWGKIASTCAGQKQSPIDLNLAKAESKTFAQITFTGYDVDLQSTLTSMKNNGHALQVDIKGDVRISAGGLEGAEYKLAQFHFHWGSNDCKGSEHTVEGQAYPAELHLVHYNTKYSDLGEAVKHADGLAVLGIFLDVGPTAHPTIKLLQEGFPTVAYAGDPSYNSLKSFKMSSLLPTNRQYFTRYDGSLTTPDCNEVVAWTVFKEPIKVSETQLYSLRSLSSSTRGEGKDTALVNNFRPVQKLNSRKLYKNYDTAFKPVAKTTCGGCGISVSVGFILFAFVLERIAF